MSYTTNFLSPFSETKEVASLALPFAQLRNPEICSAMSFDSGMKSLSTEAMSRSVGSLLPKSQKQRIHKHGFNFNIN